MRKSIIAISIVLLLIFSLANCQGFFYEDLNLSISKQYKNLTGQALSLDWSKDTIAGNFIHTSKKGAYLFPLNKSNSVSAIGDLRFDNFHGYYSEELESGHYEIHNDTLTAIGVKRYPTVRVVCMTFKIIDKDNLQLISRNKEEINGSPIFKYNEYADISSFDQNYLKDGVDSHWWQ